MQTETNINLAQDSTGEVNQIKKDHAYMVDFSKLNSVNDLILILSAMGFSFPGDHPFINQVAPFLALDNPIPLPKKTIAEKKDINLPKLKLINTDAAE